MFPPLACSLESGDNETIISVLDVYPTLLDLCGFKVPDDIKIEGRSFKPYLANPLDAENDGIYGVLLLFQRQEAR